MFYKTILNFKNIFNFFQTLQKHSQYYSTIYALSSGKQNYLKLFSCGLKSIF